MGSEEMAAAGKRLTESWDQQWCREMRQPGFFGLDRTYAPSLLRAWIPPRRSLWRRIRDAFMGFAYGWRGDVS